MVNKFALQTIFTVVTILFSSFGYGQSPASSDVSNKKLIMSGFKVWNTPIPTFMNAISALAYEESGLDGMTFNLQAVKDPAQPEEVIHMVWGWWSPIELQRSDFDRDMDAISAVGDWGRLTDNFFWGGGVNFLPDANAPGWFNDERWTIVLDNTQLLAELTLEAGFKGIFFDAEQYENGTVEAWRRMWDYPVYRDGGYLLAGETSPRSFAEVSAQVRLRGTQWAQRLCQVYPDIVIVIMNGYEIAYNDRFKKDGPALEETSYALLPSFIDGVLEGLSTEATFVSSTQRTYLMSEYKDIATQKDIVIRQSLAFSGVPELASDRLTFSPGLWIDAGYGGPESYSLTDIRVNQRSPEDHKHAVHNALAAATKYAWLWSMWPSESMVWSNPSDNMRLYWQANTDAHSPQDIAWKPEINWDLTNYDAENQQAVIADAQTWADLESQGYESAYVLPTTWKFILDPQMLLRYDYWTLSAYDDSFWWSIDTRKCWQSQGFKALERAAYRCSFEVPLSINPATHEVLLGFGAFGDLSGIVVMNSQWVGWAEPSADISSIIKPSEENLLCVYFLTWDQSAKVYAEGPGGLMGNVKILTKLRSGIVSELIFEDDFIGITLDPRWTVVDAGFDSTGGGFVGTDSDFETNGGAEPTVNSKYAYASLDAVPEGSVVTVKWAMWENTSSSWAFLGVDDDHSAISSWSQSNSIQVMAKPNNNQVWTQGTNGGTGNTISVGTKGAWRQYELTINGTSGIVGTSLVVKDAAGTVLDTATANTGSGFMLEYLSIGGSGQVSFDNVSVSYIAPVN